MLARGMARETEPDQVSPYAFLSYRWGQDGDHVLKTTTANLESHLKSIPVDKLPLALQDAITVCRGLEIPYLWIDPLCIIQDDPQAWAEDASQMDRIYLHSRLTIAALEPATCQSHILGPQQFGRQDWQTSLTAKLSTPQVFSELSPRGEEIDIFVRNGVEPPLDGGDIVPYNGALSEKFSEDHSLDRRAWCLQESTLPNRRLCFNGNEMMWECFCRKICECGHILRRDKGMQYAHMGAHLKSGRLGSEAEHFHPQPSSYEDYEDDKHSTRGVRDPRYPTVANDRWRRLVEEFTRRSVSRHEDRLNAVSGLAKLARHHINQQTGFAKNSEPNTYATGLWRNEFHFDLAWMGREALKKEKQRELNEPKQTVFSPPSWSWASVGGYVAYRLHSQIGTYKNTPELDGCVRVCDIFCKPRYQTTRPAQSLLPELHYVAAW
jgi:hypothetical protein